MPFAMARSALFPIFLYLYTISDSWKIENDAKHQLIAKFKQKFVLINNNEKNVRSRKKEEILLLFRMVCCSGSNKIDLMQKIPIQLRVYPKQ